MRAAAWAGDEELAVRAAIDAATDMVFITDDTPAAEGGPRIIYANAAMHGEFGYSEGDLLGISPEFAFGPRTDTSVIRRLREAMAAWSEVEGEFRAYRSDGTSFWTDWRGRGIIDARTNRRRWVAIGRNTDDRQARTDLMTMIGHDLRNPLTSILGYSEMLLETIVDDDARTAVRQIRAAGRRLESLAFELLTISRMERNAYEPYVEDVEVVTLLDEVIAYMPDGNRIQVEAPPQLLLQSDAGAIRHAFENLVSNALKFSTPPARVTVELTATNGGGMRARVKDTGIGIPAADLPHVFDRHTRGTNVGARHGTGLGLSFVKRLVDSLGGSVSVKSVEGRGSTFDVQIPSIAPPNAIAGGS
jgi:PAS domain S-box-containing protein